MSGINKVMILGRLGKDPEIRSTPSGQQVCNLNLATSEVYTKDGQREEKTEWHRVTLWGKQAELAAKYLKKGRNVFIEGKLQTRSWDDPTSGQKRYATDIVGSNMQFIDSAKGDSNDAPDNGGGNYDGGGYDNPAPRNASPASMPNMDDDIPF